MSKHTHNVTHIKHNDDGSVDNYCGINGCGHLVYSVRYDANGVGTITRYAAKAV